MQGNLIIFNNCKKRAKYIQEQERYQILTKCFMDEGIKGSRNAISDYDNQH
jgi:hypothetical protein